jgi:hypothetical protein
MNRAALSLTFLLVVFCLGFAVYKMTGGQEIEQQNSELDSRVRQTEQGTPVAAVRGEELQRPTAEIQTAEPALQRETTRSEPHVTMPREQDPPLPVRTCLDSDAEFGDDEIHVQGSVEVSGPNTGTSRVTDHCRLDQLVEFSCIENPTGSGRFISDARIIDCPAGSRCVSGECLQ